MAERRNKIGIIGTGFVGSTIAYATLIDGSASEMVLIDRDQNRAEGEAMDLGHGMPFVSPVQVYAGDYKDLSDASLVVIASGRGSKPDESRLDLIKDNSGVMRDVVGKILSYNRNPVILVVSNPADVLTYLALKASGLPKGRVLSTGTTLDSARLRYLLGQYFQVDPSSVHAYVIGEHGDSELPVWSSATIGGRLVRKMEGFNQAEMDKIFENVRTAAYQVIAKKRATYYAIGLAAARVIRSILRNQRTVLSVSSLMEGQFGISDVCLSLPSVVGGGGVEEVLGIELDLEEEKKFKASAQTLKKVIAEVG